MQDVLISDVAEFFVDHAISNNLGIIANAHLAMSDSSREVSTRGGWLTNLDPLLLLSAFK